MHFMYGVGSHSSRGSSSSNNGSGTTGTNGNSGNSDSRGSGGGNGRSGLPFPVPERGIATATWQLHGTGIKHALRA